MGSEHNGDRPEATIASAVEQAANPPRIILTFAGVGMADASIALDRVSPAQLYMAAWLLDAIAHEARGGQLAKAALGGIVGAPASILDDLRRAGRV